jgi:hypothetical protein
MITEERLQELELAPREAMPMKAELRELAAAYRAHIAGLKVTKDSGGHWLHFEAPNGPKASISVEVLAAQRGPIVAQALRGWSDAL